MRRTNCLKSRIRMTCCLENKFDYNVGTCLRHVSSALTAFGEKPNPVGTWYFTSAHNCDTILNINHLTRTRSIESTEKVGRGAILPFFLLITYGHSQLSIIGGVRAFRGEALAQVVDFVVVLLKKKVDCLCNSFVFSSIDDSATMHNHSPSNFPLSHFLHSMQWIFC